MNDHPDMGVPSGASANHAPTPHLTGEDHPAESDGGVVPSLMTPEIEREVAAALAAMETETAAAPADLPVTDGPIPPGTSLTGTVVGSTDSEIFLEFDAKTQGVVPRSQFGKKERLDNGRRVDVVVERFDPDAGLLIVSRQGAVLRAQWASLERGSIIEGRVTGVIKGGLEVDFQGIRAFMPGSHADLVPMKDISTLLNEPVRCEVIELDRRAKNLIVSRRKLMERERKESIEKLKQELAVGQVRRGVVKNITSFGAFVDIGGIEGLVHIRDLSWGTVNDVSEVLRTDQEIDVQILKIDLKRNRISLGLKQTTPDPWVGAEDRFPKGTNLKARIVRVADFGAFAELEPGVEGLIPLSEMGWSRVNRPSEVVSVGDMVDTIVIRMEPEKSRIALSMKQAQPDPWDGVFEGFTEQQKIKGKVTRLAGFGAFVEIAPGVEGLIHISELSDRRVKSTEDVLNVGQEIEARVLGVDKENRRISLSLRNRSDSESLEPDLQSSKPRKKRSKPLRGGLSSHFDW